MEKHLSDPYELGSGKYGYKLTVGAGIMKVPLV
jgi:hypothetical protein